MLEYCNCFSLAGVSFLLWRDEHYCWTFASPQNVNSFLAERVDGEPYQPFLAMHLGYGAGPGCLLPLQHQVLSLDRPQDMAVCCWVNGQATVLAEEGRHLSLSSATLCPWDLSESFNFLWTLPCSSVNGVHYISCYKAQMKYWNVKLTGWSLGCRKHW